MYMHVGVCENVTYVRPEGGDFTKGHLVVHLLWVPQICSAHKHLQAQNTAKHSTITFTILVYYSKDNQEKVFKLCIKSRVEASNT